MFKTSRSSIVCQKCKQPIIYRNLVGKHSNSVYGIISAAPLMRVNNEPSLVWKVVPDNGTTPVKLNLI